MGTTRQKQVDSGVVVTIIIVTTTPSHPFELIYAPQTKLHLKSIEAKYHSLIRDALEIHLQFAPELETRNLKPLKRPIISDATWELRFGPDNRFRAFYRTNNKNDEVIILAIGEKINNRLFIGGKEIKI